MKRKISIIIIIIIICILTILFPFNNKSVLAGTIRKEFIRATEKELRDTIIIDGNVWRKVSKNSVQTYTFPENSFHYYQKIGATYYIEWIQDGSGTGHFDKGTQAKSWSSKPVNGEQRGYGVWEDESPYYTMVEYDSDIQSETDFLNKSFIVKGSNGIEYTVITNNSFMDNVSLYAKKGTIEAFFKSNLDPNGTFNISDYVQTAYLERRPFKAVGIGYNIYIDNFKEVDFKNMINSKMNPNSTKPFSPMLEWYEKDGHTYIKSGSYKDQYLNYVADAKTISIGYKATYEIETDVETKGTMVGGKTKTWSWIQHSPSDYNRYTQAVNEEGDIKSANEIGIDYCELLEPATIKMPGAFRVDYKLSNGTIKSSIYIIPKIEEVQRYSYIYFKEEGTQRSLLPDGALYEQNTYSLRPSQIFNLTWKAKEFKGYELTRSVVSKSTKKGFSDELAGEKGKVRSGELSYSNSNDFNVIFYYKKVDPSNKNIINSFYNSLLVKFIYKVN